jgi:hypothetical protein
MVFAAILLLLPLASVAFHSEIRSGATFEYPIGEGLAVKLIPNGNGWEIEVGPLDSREDYANCVNPRFRGPSPKEIRASQFTGNPPHWGTGVKRQVDFVRNIEEEKRECLGVEMALSGGNGSWRPHATGRCWVRPLKVRLRGRSVIATMEFDGECALLSP